MSQPQTWLPIIYANECCGFIAHHYGKVEAFDTDEMSLGTFSSEAKAVAALFTKGGASKK